MSLQGTLDTFSLPDVLRFLATSSKTGRLEVDGPRGGGDLWLDGGAIVAGSARGTTAIVDALFELLRDRDGSFSFDAELTTSEAGAPLVVDEVIAEADTRLTEWRDIEAVVPSLEAGVVLVEELANPSVRVTAEQWRALVAVAQTGSVGGVGDRLELGEFDVSKLVKSLVETGLVDVDGAAAPAAPAPSAPARRSRSAKVAKLDASDVIASELPPDEAEEVMRQLAALGPEAVEAVEKAARATTPEERAAALDEVADDDPVNRGLLLKFLSSVRT